MPKDDTDRLKDVFITDEEHDEIKEFVRSKFLSKFDWREGYRHLDIYNRINHKSGILKKLEQCRRDISCTSAEEIIELLYIVGYSHKRIIFLLWEWGFDNINRKIVATHLVRKKFDLKRKRLQFMELITNTKDSIFQDIKSEVMDRERKTADIYLEAIDKLQEALALLDPVKDRLKFVGMSATIDSLQSKLNEYNGIDLARKETIKSHGAVMTAKRIKELESDKPPNLEEQHSKTIEAQSNVLR